MSLSTDTAFIAALKSSREIVALTSSRIYGTAIAVPDEDMDNTPVPYVIVTYNGMTNDVESKDAGMEGSEDTVQIGLELTASSLKTLHELASKVRVAVREYMETGGHAEAPIEYTLSSGPISYDAAKPCYWMVLNYSCVTNAE